MPSASKTKIREWLHRYIIAEILGTIIAVAVATFTYERTHSYVGAAAAGWVGEGIGFYGYFITTELVQNIGKYRQYSLPIRFYKAGMTASTNLLVEFLPAELLDNFIIRPYAMYVAPRYIHPYAFGFLAGKFSADIVFYMLAIVGYEASKRWSRLKQPT